VELSGHCEGAVIVGGDPQMVTFDLLQFIAAAFVVCGLAAVVLEIVLRDPRWLWEIVGDVRRFAERPFRSKERGGKSAPNAKRAASRNPRILV
jgi:hypothetical protein